MKKHLKIILLLAACIGFGNLSCSAQNKKIEQGIYRIEYPANWIVDNSKTMGTEIILLSPLENANDKFQENFNLLIQDLHGKNIDLDQYAKISIGQIKQSATEGKILTSQKIKADRFEYYKMVFEMRQGQFKLTCDQYYIIRNEKAYVLTFTAEAGKFEAVRNTGEKILNSFEFTK